MEQGILRRCRGHSRRILKELLAMGWRAVRSRKHIILEPPEPDGTRVVMASSPSDYRSWRALVTQLRHRAGIDLRYLFGGAGYVSPGEGKASGRAERAGREPRGHCSGIPVRGGASPGRDGQEAAVRASGRTERPGYGERPSRGTGSLAERSGCGQDAGRGGGSRRAKRQARRGAFQDGRPASPDESFSGRACREEAAVPPGTPAGPAGRRLPARPADPDPRRDDGGQDPLP